MYKSAVLFKYIKITQEFMDGWKTRENKVRVMITLTISFRDRLGE